MKMKKHSTLKCVLSMVLLISAVLQSVHITPVYAAEDAEIKIMPEQVHAKSADGHGPELAFDGDLDTYYQTPEVNSNYDYARYMDIDLGTMYEISGIKIYNIEGSYNHYQIYASEDGINYNKIAFKSDDKMPDSENGDSYTFDSKIKACGLRINLSYNSAGIQGNLSEVKVFGNKLSEDKPEKGEAITVSNFEDTKWYDEWNKFESDKSYANAKTTAEMTNLVGRVIGDAWKDDFVFEIKEFPSGNDTYEIESLEDGRVIIRGNNGIAMASGFNYYLRYFCKVDYNPLFVSNLEMPETLPEVEGKITKETQYDVRYALNFCTYSYTMAFWSWEEYEAFLDWAAMSGINLVLDIVGQEEIIRRTLLEYGYDNEEIKDYIAGPAYFAWYYMQNMTSFGGPLPDYWFESRVELGRQIHDRMQTYGIRPALSGFSGMVPNDFKEKNPNAVIVDQGTWCGFQRPDMLRVYVDDGQKDYFGELADTFYEAQKDVYGEITDYYAVDPFHEGGKTGDMDLTKVYETVQNKMLEHDPNGIWVIQQWSGSLNDAKLQGLKEKENALILDLSSEYNSYADVMERNQIPWVWNMIHAFGGRLGIEADANTISQEIPAAYEKYDYMQGIGMTPESLERCPMIYELLWDMAWTKDPIDPMEWGRQYMERRYGGVNDSLMEAWSILLRNAWNEHGAAQSVINARPTENYTSTSSWGSGAINYDQKDFEKVFKIFIDNYEAFKDSECYVYDLVDIARQVLSNSALDYHKLMVNAYRANDLEDFEEKSDHFLKLIQIQNDILEVSDYFLTGTWLNDARTMFEDADDWTKDLFEFNARCQITTWGGKKSSDGGGLRDYSHRQWAGVTEDFYLQRWTMWVDEYKAALEEGRSPSGFEWFNTEWKWVNRKSDEGFAYPVEGDAETNLGELINEVYENYTVTNIEKIFSSDENENQYTNLLKEKKAFTESDLTEEENQALTDGNTETGWIGENNEWPAIFEYDLGAEAIIDEVSFVTKPVVASGIPVTYVIEVMEDGVWKEIARDDSGNIGGRVNVKYNGTITKIRFSFNSGSEEERPEFKEFEAYGTQVQSLYENVAEGAEVTVSETRGGDPANVTDGDISTKWLANDGTSPAWATVTFEAPEYVDNIEIYFEKAGLRFVFDISVILEDGTQKVVFDKQATNEDMPVMYSIPVNATIKEITVNFKERESGGQFYAARFGIYELKALKKADGYDAVETVNVAAGQKGEVTDFNTGETYSTSNLTDDNLDTIEMVTTPSEDYDFVPSKYAVIFNEPIYVEDAVIYFEKAGVRFKFKVEVTNEEGTKTILDMAENTEDLKASYQIPVQDKITRIDVTLMERCEGGEFYLASSSLREIKLLGPMPSISAEADVKSESGKDVSSLLDSNVDTGVSLAEDKIFFQFAELKDVSSLAVTPDESTTVALKYRILYKAENPEGEESWIVAADHANNVIQKGRYAVKLGDGIRTQELCLEILNTEAVELNEVDIYKKDFTSNVLEEITKYENLIKDIETGDKAGNYGETEYNMLAGFIEECRTRNLSELTSAEAEEIINRLEQLYIELRTSYVTIDRMQLLNAMNEAYFLAEGYELLDEQAMYEELEKAKLVYETYEVSQTEIDQALEGLRNMIDQALSSLDLIDQVDAKIAWLQKIAEEAAAGEMNGQYPQSAIDELKMNVETAQKARNEAETDEDLKGIITMLDEAEDTFVNSVVNVDTEALMNTMAEFEALNAEDYTEDSWISAENQYEKAKELLESGAFSQRTVDEMEQTLTDMMNALVKFEDSVNKQSLYDLLTEYAEYKSSDYTQESWKVFEEAYRNACEVYQNSKSSQEEVDNACTILGEGAEQLKKADSDVPKDENPDENLPGGDGFEASGSGEKGSNSISAGKVPITGVKESAAGIFVSLILSAGLIVSICMVRREKNK